MVADLPENYKNNPAFNFIKQVPLNWDKTIVLKSKIGDYIAIARKKDKNWYVGCITDEKSRKINIPLYFLQKNKKYKATIYSDNKGIRQKNDSFLISINRKIIENNDEIIADLISSGGLSVIIRPNSPCN
jgi:alpha-glucosidase